LGSAVSESVVSYLEGRRATDYRETGDARLGVLQRTGRKSGQCLCDPCASSAPALADYRYRARAPHARSRLMPRRTPFQPNKNKAVEPRTIVIVTGFSSRVV
jgi:hypothetical protein